jgi:hypothetical protein
MYLIHVLNRHDFNKKKMNLPKVELEYKRIDKTALAAGQVCGFTEPH